MFILEVGIILVLYVRVILLTSGIVFIIPAPSLISERGVDVDVATMP